MAGQIPASRLVQKELAKRIISRLHSEKDFQKAMKTSEKLFKEGKTIEIDLSNLPIIKHMPGTRLAEHLISNKHVQSMREYREFVNQGAIKIDGEKVTDENHIPEISGEHIIINIGKKRRVVIKK
jgi:tyrosyl-tRNA synthetase